MYLSREIEKVLKKAEHQTKVILLTGPRQVGKSTSIRHTFSEYTYITLDNENDLFLAKSDRALFFRDREFPLIIDEVQYAEELLRSTKKVVDEKDGKGLIFLTGSQTYELFSLASESLSGRVTILEMNTLSCREIYDCSYELPFVPSEDYFADRHVRMKPYTNIWAQIHRGFMPEMLDPERDWEWFYRDYVRTYIERDIRRIINIKDEIKFRKLLVSLAARSAEVLVYDSIARDVGVDIKTVQSWVSVIAASGLIKIIHPFHNNYIKRAIKAPKLFFMDTGLMCYLVGWKSAESAENGAMSGSIFETYVVSEIIKSFINAGRDTNSIFYYRDKDKKEIDLVIEQEDTLYPIEVKKGATIDRSWTSNFSVLNKISDHTIERGCVICRCDEKRNITEDAIAVPIDYI